MAFDYKIHVFGGRARFVEVFADRFTAKKCSIFDRDWRLTDAGYEGRPSAGRMKRPDRLDEMLEVAEALAGDLDYLRADLYAPGDSIYVGEMTVYPASGFRRIDPPEWDLRWGEMWKLPEATRGR